MGSAPVLSVPRWTWIDRIARLTERLLRGVADARLGLGLLLVAALVNAVAAALPSGAWLVRTPAYLVLLGGTLVTGLAALAVRTPVAWREWRRPRAFPDSREVLRARIPVPEGQDLTQALDAAFHALRGASYRVMHAQPAELLTLAAVRRGWSQVAGLGAHGAMLLLVLGAGLGLAFGHETTFSLVAGEQALLDDARPGFTDAVRLDAFDTAFTPDHQPTRLDTRVTFLRGGSPVAAATVQVNSPGSFDGYLLHGWTYGPAVRLRVTSLGGRPLLDAALPLDDTIADAPGAFTRLEPVGTTLGVSLVAPESNTVRVSVATETGDVDTATLVPGGEARLGAVNVRLDGLTAYVTFLSRRDPGMGLLFGGAALLVAALVVALWLPRRRVTVRVTNGALHLLVRGGRYDDPSPDLQRLRDSLEASLKAAGATSVLET